jgi:predicted cobalt transporter CbtA
MLVGALAGLLAFGFGSLFGEPPVGSAIAFEDQMHQSMGMAPEMELVSREVQSTIGLFTGVVIYGSALGGLFALAFAYADGRVGRLAPRGVSALVAALGFIAIVLVPALTYPPNPPAVGEPETIGHRTALYFAMMLISLVGIAAAVAFGQRLVGRIGIWNAVTVAGAAFVAVVAAAQFLLPAINEVPEHFPADVLWRFRIASLGIQVILWTTMGLVFGALTERSLSIRRA